MIVRIQTEEGLFDAELSYTISGRYIPATRTDPEEYPEVEWEIESVKDLAGEEIDDVELTEAIRQKLIDMDISSDILGNESDRREHERAEYLMERKRDEGY